MKKSISRLLFIMSIYTPALLFGQQQLPNPGFEAWEDAGTVRDEPVAWSSIKTSDNEITNPAAPVVWNISDDAHSGNHSIYLENMETFGIVATGVLTNGRVHADFNPDSGYAFTQRDDEKWFTAFSEKPDSLVGWYKYYPVGGDQARVRAVLHIAEASLPERDTYANFVADAHIQLPPDTVDEWTRFSVAFNYLNDWTPEYILLVLQAGYGTEAVAGSKVLYDDFELIYNNPGAVKEGNRIEYHIYYYQNKVYFKDIPLAYSKNSEFILLDLNGQIVFEMNVDGMVIELDKTIQKGVYIGKLINKNRIITQKMFIY